MCSQSQMVQTWLWYARTSYGVDMMSKCDVGCGWLWEVRMCFEAVSGGVHMLCTVWCVSTGSTPVRGWTLEKRYWFLRENTDTPLFYVMNTQEPPKPNRTTFTSHKDWSWFDFFSLTGHVPRNQVPSLRLGRRNKWRMQVVSTVLISTLVFEKTMISQCNGWVCG